ARSATFGTMSAHASVAEEEAEALRQRLGQAPRSFMLGGDRSAHHRPQLARAGSSGAAFLASLCNGSEPEPRLSIESSAQLQLGAPSEQAEEGPFHTSEG
ncbi:unnamed protein product, partial [Polarella glacialis]